MYKISIIVPVYNAERFLDKCITSIVNQSYKNLEIILINDGSSDKSLEICNKYAKIDNRIIVINKENGGVASARNKGLDVTTGDFIGFIDSDDYISIDMYEKLLKAIVNTSSDIAECGYIGVNPTGDNLRPHPLKDDIIDGIYECTYSYLNKVNTENFNCNKIYKKEIFEDLRYSNYKYSEDYLINSKAFSMCKRKVTISDCCYYYVSHEDSACNIEFNEKRFDIIKAGKEVLDYIDNIFPELSKYVILYIINYIRKIYFDLINSTLSKKEDLKRELVQEYKKYYKMVKRELKQIVKNRNTYIALWIFDKSPKLYYLIEKGRRNDYNK